MAGARAYSSDEPCPGTAARIVAFNQAQAAAQPNGEAYQRPNVPTDGSFTRRWAQARLTCVERKLRGANSARLTLHELSTSASKDVQRTLPELEAVVLNAEGRVADVALTGSG